MERIMRHAKWLTCWLALTVSLSTVERGFSQQRSAFISDQPVNRLFDGRSRLLVSSRPSGSLFSVTDFWSTKQVTRQDHDTLDWQPTDSPEITLLEPTEPAMVPLVVPAPFAEQSIDESLPAVKPGLPAIPDGTIIGPSTNAAPRKESTEDSTFIPVPTSAKVVVREATHESLRGLPVVEIPDTGTDEAARRTNGVLAELAEPIVGPLTVQRIRQQVMQLEAATAVAPAGRLEAIQVYNQAIAFLETAEKTRTDTKLVQQLSHTIPKQLVEARESLKTIKATPQRVPTEGATAGQLEAQLAELQRDIVASEQSRRSLTEQLEQIEERVRTVSTTEPELTRAITQATTLAPPGDNSAKNKALAALNSARKAMLRSQLDLARAQQSTEAQHRQLLTLQIAGIDAKLDREKAESVALRKTVDQLHDREAAEKAQRAKVIAEQVHAELKPFANDNAVIAERLSWLQSRISETVAQTEEATSLEARVAKSFERVRKTQERTGLNSTLGLILNHELEHLPGTRQWQRRISGIEDLLRRLSEVEFEIESRHRDCEDFDARVTTVVSKLCAEEPSRSEALRRMGQEILTSHESLIEQANRSAQDYSASLTTLNDECDRVVATIEAFESHINKNVLWIRSNEPLGISDFTAFSPMAMHLGSPNLWLPAADSVLAAVQENLLSLALSALVILVVMTFGTEIRKRLQQAADRAGTRGSIRLWPTWEAIALTCLLAFAWPGFFWTLGWAVSRSLSSTGLALACGYALQTAAMWFGAFALPRCICLPNGLAHRHFGWRESSLRSVHDGLPKVMKWGVPVVAIVALLSEYDHGKWSGSVGRITFICGALALAFYVRRALDTRKGFLAESFEPTSVVHKLRHPISVLSVSVLVALAITSAAGYHHSALRLTKCLQQTWVMAIGLAVAFGVLIRGLDWIVQSFAVRKPALHATVKSEPFDPNTEAEQAATTEKELATNREQVQRFLAFGTAVAAVLCCWGIWHNVLPALNVVNDIELWSMAKEVPVVAESAVQGEAVRTIKQAVPVTLGDVIRGLIILIVTIAAARSLPGLLDTLVLMRLPLDRGGRHAVSTISRYVLITVGMLLTLQQVGVDWASLQWMVAAMTVGLGFGLQEIFANFVSGLIILLERPIRLGDFVTVNGETGFVTRIQFRATTITDLDRRELLVPNKKFITDELINWTLSDPITRLVLPIGIAYGSDTTLAHQLLVEVAESHPIVLKEPAPSAMMTSFGDSTLNFELRVYIPRRDEFAQITHELNTAIDRKFRTANIEIAFPQCDINVRGLEQLTSLAMRKAA